MNLSMLSLCVYCYLYVNTMISKCILLSLCVYNDLKVYAAISMCILRSQMYKEEFGTISVAKVVEKHLTTPRCPVPLVAAVVVVIVQFRRWNNRPQALQLNLQKYENIPAGLTEPSDSCFTILGMGEFSSLLPRRNNRRLLFQFTISVHKISNS